MLRSPNLVCIFDHGANLGTAPRLRISGSNRQRQPLPQLSCLLSPTPTCHHHDCPYALSSPISADCDDILPEPLEMGLAPGKAVLDTPIRAQSSLERVIHERAPHGSHKYQEVSWRSFHRYTLSLPWTRYNYHCSSTASHFQRSHAIHFRIPPSQEIRNERW